MAKKRDDKAFVDLARQRFHAASSADARQRARELSDLGFLVDHWPADVRAARSGIINQGPNSQGQNAIPPVPARPCIQIDNLTEPINRVLNQERQSDINVQIVPADDFGDLGIQLDETEITLREGLVRRIQRESQAADARTWAFKRAVQAGRGYYLVNTRFLPGKSWDKEVYVHRIYNQDGVRIDPAHEQPDGSDANWGFLGGWVPWDVYKATWPSAGKRRNAVSDADEGEFSEWAQAIPEWVNAVDEINPDGKLLKGKGVGKAVYVVDYWYAELTSRQLLRLEDGSGVWVDEYDGEIPEGADIRDVVDRTIHYAKLDGINDFPLEETEWEGPDIPIVKVLGDELQPFDSERRVQGMVRPARDSQFGYDAMISKLVEQIALAPIPVLDVDPESITGYEHWWAMLNTRTLPYAPSRTWDDNGRQLKPPTRLPSDPNILPAAQAITLFKQGIESTTSTPDPALGRTDPSVKSKAHAAFLAGQADFSTSNFLDNLIRSMRYEGQIENNLLYPIYGKRPGRIARILTGEGESELMAINSPEDVQNAQVASKVGRLTEHAKCNVIIKVTKSSDSRRDQETTVIAELLNANPEFITWFGDLFFRNQDGPGHVQMAERAKVMLAPPIQKMLAEKEQGREPLPPAAQAQINELQQRLQMAEAAMQELAEEARGKKVESQTKLQIAALEAQRDHALEQLRAQTELEKARMDNAAKIHVAEIAAHTKGVQMAHEAEHEAIAMAHEAATNEVAADRAQAESQQQRQHEVAMGAAQTGAQADEAESGREFEAGEARRAREAEANEAERGRQHEAVLTQAQLEAQASQQEASE